MPSIPELKRQRQKDVSEFLVNLVYEVSSKTARTTWRDPGEKKRGGEKKEEREKGEEKEREN